MRKFGTAEGGILIRNNRLEIMRNAGLTIDYEILNHEDYVLALKNKIIEEANEVVDTTSNKEMEEEIGDLLEVIGHLIEVNSLDRERITKFQADKLQKLGGFDQRIKVKGYYVKEDNENYLPYFLKNAHKYPEIKD